MSICLNKFIEEVCIIDCSGSMEERKQSAIESFNSFLKAQQDLGSDVGARMTLVTFSDRHKVKYDSIPIEAIPKLNSETYICNGSTALYDAVGSTIDMIGKRLAETPEEARPAKVIVTILTDGEENSSIKYTSSMVKRMIEHQESKYSWEFIYLSSDINVKEHAATIGVTRSLYYDIKKGMGNVYNTMSTTYSSARIDLEKQH